MALKRGEPRRFSRDDYYRLGESGVFARTERVELIDGTVVTVSPLSYSHTAALMLGNMLLTELFRDTHSVGCRLPIPIGDHSEPEPDYSLVSLAHLKACCEQRSKPTCPDLVIEVSDSSYAYDTGEKASLYASAGIPEYWVLDLRTRRLEVRRQPGPDADAFLGHSYRSLQVHLADETVSPAFSSTVQVNFSQLLPQEFGG
jgi:Uma2 family endonuclease